MSFVEYLKPRRYGDYLPAIESTMRTTFYVALSLLLLKVGTAWIADRIRRRQPGFILADYITWPRHNDPEFLDNVAVGAWDAAINAAAGVVIFHLCKLQFPNDTEGSTTGFLVFLTVLAVKSAYYGLREISGELAED